MSQATYTVEVFTHRAILGGDTFLFDISSPNALASFVEQMSAKGANVADLQVLSLDAPHFAVNTTIEKVAPPTNVVQLPQPVQTPAIKVGEYDAVGDARSQRDREAAKAAGFAPAMPVYRQGLRATGMERHRAEFEALPYTGDAAAKLARLVDAEERQDVNLERSMVCMNNRGELVNPSGTSALALNDRAFGSLVARMGMPPGAGQYLPAVPAALRATNINAWTESELKPAEAARVANLQAQRKNVDVDYLALRTRKNPGNDGARECYAVVSDKYAEFDANKLARAIELAAPAGSRASWSYDGSRTKFDVLFFSNINPEHAVAGEFFKAGVQIRTDDTGGGGLRVQAGIWQNLCLNFIIIDNASTGVVSLRHLGDPRKLAVKFREAFAAAQEKIGYFTKAWGYAVNEDVKSDCLVMANAQGVLTRDEATSWVNRPAREFLAGLFNGIMERDLVPLPRKDRAQTVANLLTMVDRDTSYANRDRNVITRGTVVNALTRFAHEVNSDPFKESAIEAAAGALLFPASDKFSKPAPLPFMPIAAFG